MTRAILILETLPRGLWRIYLAVEVEDRGTKGEGAVNIL